MFRFIRIKKLGFSPGIKINDGDPFRSVKLLRNSEASDCPEEEMTRKP